MNKRQRLLSAAAAATLGLAGLIGAAAPAHAAITLTDNNNGSVTVTGLTNIDSIHFCATSIAANACGPLNQLYGSAADGTYTGGSTVFPGPVALPAGTYTVSVYDGTANTSTGLSPVTITGGGSSDDSSSDVPGFSTPAPVIQQFGMPATGICDEAQPEGLNLAGVPSGGWGVSWAQWMNGGTGGAVCTRTLNYSTVQSKWVVN